MQSFTFKSLLIETLIKNSQQQRNFYGGGLEYFLIKAARFKYLIKIFIRHSLNLILRPHIAFRRFVLLFFRGKKPASPTSSSQRSLNSTTTTVSTVLSKNGISLSTLPTSRVTTPVLTDTADISTSPPFDDETTTNSEAVDFLEEEEEKTSHVDYDALVEEFNRTSENDEEIRRRRQPQMQLIIPTNRKKELDSASQIAKLDFLERHLQLLGDCLTEATIIQQKQINPLHRTGSRQSRIMNSLFPLVACPPSSSLASMKGPFVGKNSVAEPFSHLTAPLPQASAPLRNLPRSDDDDALVNRRYAEDCLRKEHQSSDETNNELSF